MQDAGVIQPSSRELERLMRVDLAAKAFVQAQMAVWAHRQHLPETAKGIAYWAAERDDLADEVERTLVVLTEAAIR